MTVWPGCELSGVAERYGECETDWSKLAHQRVTFIPHGMTKKDLIEASKSAFRRFYLRPRIILNFAESLASLRGIRTLVLGFITFCRSVLREA